MATILKPKEQGKTKADLLRVMGRWGACPEAFGHVNAHTSESAEDIGITSPRPENLYWLLIRRLDAESRARFERRLSNAGYPHCWCDSCLQPPNRERVRAVVDDCWRAWCRS